MIPMTLATLSRLQSSQLYKGKLSTARHWIRHPCLFADISFGRHISNVNRLQALKEE